MNLKQKTFSGLKWSTFQQGITQVSTFITGIILMRLLSPAEFGLMAMVAVFSSFLVVFQDLGITVSLIQKEKLEEDDKQVVFWMMFLTSIVLALILFLGSGAIANFYNEQELKNIAKVLSINILFGAFGSVNSALLRREMEFKQISLYRTFSVIAGAIIAIILAYSGLGVWALVWQSLTVAILFSVLISFRSRFVPSLNFSWITLREHVSFGLPLFGSRALTYFSKNTDKFVIGKIMTSSDLGIYTRAMNLVYLPIHKLSMIFTSVMYVSLTKVKSDKNKSLKIYGFIARSTMYLIIPFVALFYFNAQELVLLLFGAKWLAIVGLMKIFTFLVIFHLVGVLRGNIVVAQGRPDLEFKFNIASVVLDITAVIIGAFFGLKIIAVALVSSALVKLIYALSQISLVFETTYLNVVKEIAKGFFAIFIIGFLSFVLSNILTLLGIETNFGLVINLLLLIITMIFFIMSLDRPIYFMLKEALGKR